MIGGGPLDRRTSEARVEPPNVEAAGFCSPSESEVRRAVRTKTRALLVERLRTSLLLTLASLSFFLIQDLVFFRDLAALLLLIKGFQFSTVCAVLWLIRTQRLPRNTTVFAVGLASLLAFCATAAGVVRGSANGTPLLFIVITAATAVGAPWGARAQAVFVGACATLLAWNDYAIHGTLSPELAGPATASMLIAGLLSVFVAHSVERYRWQIEEREMGLRLREDLFRSLIENGGDLIAVVGADGIIRYVSPSITYLLGHAPNVWMGMRLFDFVHPEDASRLGEVLAASERESGGVRRVEARFRDAAQTWRSFDGAITNLLENPAVQGFVFNARDVTQRRQIESDLRRNQAELTHVLRLGTISEIAAALAHEINQPLSAISNYAGACTRRLQSSEAAPPELEQGLQLIAAEALRAGRIVHGLRTLSRKGDGGMEMIDLNEVVRHAVELMEPQAHLQGISLRWHAGERLPSVYADGIQIEQVVLNLLLNGIESVQATPLKAVSASTSRRNGCVEVLVSDTGIGLDPGVVERVFEPFFTTKPTGLGMGLAISRRIIEAHGGTFHCGANPEGRGSTFSFSLPLATEQSVT